MVVELNQTEFREGEPAEEAVCQAVVLIPKGGGEYRGIGLVEVMWKAVSVILNRRFTTSTTYHDYLHGFQAGCGTGTVTLEVNLLQQVVALREAVLHVIFLYLNKAYNDLDRSRCLEILEGYVVGTTPLRLLHRYCERLNMVERAGEYYGENFRGERGLTQGEPMLPTIFNLVVDAVVRHWKSLVAEQKGGDSSDADDDKEQMAGRTIRE